MTSTDDVPIKALIAQALENCTDSELLDLIYKLLIFESPEQQTTASEPVPGGFFVST